MQDCNIQKKNSDNTTEYNLNIKIASDGTLTVSSSASDRHL